MPIREFSMRGVPRSKIAFFKEMPPASDLERFRERRFDCVTCTEKDLGDPGVVALLDAVIFSQKQDQRNSLCAIFPATIPMLLKHDVRVYVRIAPDPDKTPVARKLVLDALLSLGVPLGYLQPDELERIPNGLRERESSLLAPYVHIFDSGVDWRTIAHIVCDHPAGNAPNKILKIDGLNASEISLPDREEGLLLLQRSFFDCSTLHLQPIAEGLSGAPVFKAYASLQDGLAGEWPYLHFVKLGSRKKIIDEYDKYIGRALDYVPFHLGPRLRLDRCNLGASLGILVGDFVEGAELIRDSAPAGRAGHAIANLFDKTLGAWRKQAMPDSDRTLEQYLDGKWVGEDGDEIKLSSKRVEIVKLLGGDPDVAPMRSIFNRGNHRPVLCAPAHGDLHATNVLVRGGDAIIIDFEKMTDRFPLLYDPASLESGLLVDGFRRDLRSAKNPKDLLEALSSLYTLDVLKRHVVPCHAADPSSWFYDCVAQIRMLCRHADLSGDQYALVLGVCLIRKGCNPATLKPPQENLRAISFILGQRIMREIGQNLT